MLERSIQYCIDIIIAILQNTNLLNDNFSFCRSLNRLYVVTRYVVVKEEMTNQPNIGIIFQTFTSCTQFHHNMLYSCTCICVHTHTRSYMNAYMHVHTHTYMYIHAHIDIHAHRGTPHTCEHAHTHTHMGTYRRRGMIRWAKHSRFQPYEFFAEIFLWCIGHQCSLLT